MNYRMTSFILGRMLGVEALVMVIPARSEEHTS